MAATRRRGKAGRGTPAGRRPGAKAKAKAKATPARKAKATARKATPARTKAPAARKAKAPARRARKAPARGRSRSRPAGPAPGVADLAAAAERDDRAPADEVLELFRHYDRDASGSIDARELAALLEALGASPSEEELAVALDIVDRNRSGKISWPEFSAWWKAR